LPNGDPVVVNADGTVSVVAETSLSEASGTPVIFETSAIYNLSSVFDSNSNKIVIAYRDVGGSSYGKAIVGTVDPSDNSISFGTEVVFNSAYSPWVATTFDSTSNKVVVAYADGANSSRGYAKVGTVSGNSISFGAASQFNTDGNSYTAMTYDSAQDRVVVAYRGESNQNGYARTGAISGTSITWSAAVQFNPSTTIFISTAYDAASGKTVIAYRDSGDSSRGKAIVGTVSASSISFGFEVQFNSGFTTDTFMAYDSSNEKIIISYRDDGNSGHGTAIVGTVSGTSISFGSKVVFEAAATSFPAITFDSSANKVVISYQDVGNSSYATAISGTVSGSSITFDTPYILYAGYATFFATTFDSNSNKVVTCYADSIQSDFRYYGNSVVYQPASTSTNLTAENYIGLSSNGYPDTAGATIDVQGAINDRQSGLTAGQAYYVQTDGTLTTTAGDPSVFAGTAISATKMIVKG
jgi:hypothetical protein